MVVIPARWASTRFPGKVLAPLAGQPMVLHVCQLAARARQIDRVVVATDDSRVRSVVEAAGFEVVLTRPDHPSGTDRVAEVAASTADPLVIGLQADEPFLEPADLDRLADALAQDQSVSLVTLREPIGELAEYLDPNLVKVVCNAQGDALLFSRAPIPFARPTLPPLTFPPQGLPTPALAYKHLGVYAWRRERLLEFCRLPVGSLETTEGLEQLRAVQAGWKIRVLDAQGTAFGIDTPADLHRAELHLAAQRNRA